jgi:putative hydrolase of the HAD superfamily
MNTGNGNSHAYPRKIRAVILDYGEVICRPPSTEHLGRMATLFRIPREQFLPIYVASRNPYDGGDVSAEEYWRQFAKSGGVEVNDSMVEKLREWDLEMWSSINPKMVEWLAAIHSAGFKTALLSNHLVLSCEARAIKPDLAIYHRCLSALGVPPSETLFIDDREKNIEAAQTVGIVGLSFQSTEKLYDDLGRVGFPIRPSL